MIRYGAGIGRSWLLGLLTLLVSTTALSGQATPKVTFNGQVRPRTENVSSGDGNWDSSTSMRVRGALTAHLDGGVKVFIQLQDVRLFGEEADTKGDYRADNFDLHQGFIEVEDFLGAGETMRVGRQEMSLGEQRLVGPVNWGQQGRSFDGLRFSGSSHGLKVDLFGMKLSEATAPQRDYDSEFFGVWGSVATGNAGTLDAFGLFTREARDDGAEEQTVGALWRGEIGLVDFRAETSVQRGTRGGEDVSAHMLGLRAGTTLSNGLSVTLWYDYLSGDKDPGDGETEVFNTLYATNHAFYGKADYFTNIPLHTGGLGLKDAALKLGFSPWEGTSVNVDLHNFQTTQKGTLSTQSLGNEIDLSLNRVLSPGFTLTTGYSFFQARDGMLELGRISEDGQWIFLMLDASF